MEDRNAELSVRFHVTHSSGDRSSAKINKNVFFGDGFSLFAPSLYEVVFSL